MKQGKNMHRNNTTKKKYVKIPEEKEITSKEKMQWRNNKKRKQMRQQK